MLMALGLFVFERATLPFDARQRRSSWRHATSDRVGDRAASQFLGPGDETVSLSGCCVPEVGGTYSSLDTIRAMAGAGDEYPLVDGAGNVWGSYVITDLDESARHFVDNGIPRVTDFAIELRRTD